MTQDQAAAIIAHLGNISFSIAALALIAAIQFLIKAALGRHDR